ncbi:MAG: P-loop NTPase [Candidatus Methylomirabilia bacterium]
MKKYRDIVGDGGSGIVAQVEEQHRRLRERLAAVRHAVAVISGKGGVGKSSVTVNLAAAFAREGFAVGVLDADLNGPSIAKMLGVRGRSLTMTTEGVLPPDAQGIRVMSMDLLLPSDDAPLSWEAETQAESYTWRGSMEANALREFLADTVWQRLDLLLIDLPPGAERLSTVAGLLPSVAGTVVVTIPSEVSHLVVRRSISVVRDLKIPILGLLENMAGYLCLGCGQVGELFLGPGGEQVAADHGIAFLGRIPFDPRMALASDRGVPFVVEHPDSPAARALGEARDRIKAALALGVGA